MIHYGNSSWPSVKDKCVSPAKVYCVPALRKSSVLTSALVLQMSIVLASASLHVHVIIHFLGCACPFIAWLCAGLLFTQHTSHVTKSVMYTCGLQIVIGTIGA